MCGLEKDRFREEVMFFIMEIRVNAIDIAEVKGIKLEVTCFPPHMRTPRHYQS